jgi:hypothetical protein
VSERTRQDPQGAAGAQSAEELRTPQGRSVPGAQGGPRGTLVVVARAGAGQAGPLREESLPFTTLAELLDLCAARAAGDAFLRVYIEDADGGSDRRLVLDFGQFGKSPA